MSGLEGDASSAHAHQTKCPNHEDRDLCHGIRKDGSLCNYRARTHHPGCLPMCKPHSEPPIQMGKCRALEDCGHPCGRAAVLNEPYNLCRRHEKGTNTLPCHFLRLPTELRLMVYRHLIPETVDAKLVRRISLGLLHLNKEIYQEVSSEVYKKTWFKAIVEPDTITMIGKSWKRVQNTRHGVIMNDIHEAFRHEEVKHIQNLHIIIRVGMYSVFGRQNREAEEEEVYETRDTVRKLAALLSPVQSHSTGEARSLETLIVEPIFTEYQVWSPAEKIAALFSAIEPLQVLWVKKAVLKRPTQEGDPTLLLGFSGRFAKLETMWLAAMKEGPSDTKALSNARTSAAMSEAYRRVERAALSVWSDAMASDHPVVATAFGDVHRVLYATYVAYENNDLSAMVKIQEAIAMRWVQSSQMQQRQLQVTANIIGDMFDHKLGAHNPRDTFPSSFATPIDRDVDEDAGPFQIPHQQWTQLSDLDHAPCCNDPGVYAKLSGNRVILKIGGRRHRRVYTRLLTPQRVRELEASFDFED